MKEEALKLAVWLENMSKLGWADNFGQELDEISAMIRRLVEELDKAETLIQAHQIRPRGKSWLLNENDIFGAEPYFQQWAEQFRKQQQRPLREDEIIKKFNDSDLLQSWGSQAPINQDVIDFVRAIEERHGIK